MPTHDSLRINSFRNFADNVDKQVNVFTEVINDSKDTNAPFVTPAPWINDDIKRAITDRMCIKL